MLEVVVGNTINDHCVPHVAPKKLNKMNKIRMLVVAEESKMNNYRADASRSPGLKDSLRKWVGSQPAGNRINNYCSFYIFRKGSRLKQNGVRTSI